MSDAKSNNFEERIKEYEKYREEKIKDLKYIFEVSGILIAFLIPIALKIEDYFSNEWHLRYFFLIAHMFLFIAFFLNVIFAIVLKNITKIKNRTEDEIEDEIDSRKFYMKLELYWVYGFFLSGIIALAIVIFIHYENVRVLIS